jgi:hypothetical protein
MSSSLTAVEVCGLGPKGEFHKLQEKWWCKLPQYYILAGGDGIVLKHVTVWLQDGTRADGYSVPVPENAGPNKQFQ